MDPARLKKLVRSANLQLKTEPLSIANGNGLPSLQNSLPSIQCFSCEDVRRQNYQIKQELYQYEERNEKMIETEKQLTALKELYELKCKEVELVRRQLEKSKNKISEMESKTRQYCTVWSEGIMRKLSDLENGSKGQHF